MSLEITYTPEEVAEALKTTPQTINRWIREGSLRARRAGRLVRLKKADVENFLEELDPISIDSIFLEIDQKNHINFEDQGIRRQIEWKDVFQHLKTNLWKSDKEVVSVDTLKPGSWWESDQLEYFLNQVAWIRHKRAQSEDPHIERIVIWNEKHLIAKEWRESFFDLIWMHLEYDFSLFVIDPSHAIKMVKEREFAIFDDARIFLLDKGKARTTRMATNASEVKELMHTYRALKNHPECEQAPNWGGSQGFDLYKSWSRRVKKKYDLLKDGIEKRITEILNEVQRLE